MYTILIYIHIASHNEIFNKIMCTIILGSFYNPDAKAPLGESLYIALELISLLHDVPRVLVINDARISNHPLRYFVPFLTKGCLCKTNASITLSSCQWNILWNHLKVFGIKIMVHPSPTKRLQLSSQGISTQTKAYCNINKFLAACKFNIHMC
jgi:hypothetical protein